MVPNAVTPGEAALLPWSNLDSGAPAEPSPPLLLPGLQSIDHQRICDGASRLVALARAGTLLSYRPLIPERESREYSGEILIGSLPLLSYCSTGFEAMLEPATSVTLRVVLEGEGEVLDPLGTASFSRCSALLLPCGSGPRRSSCASGLSVAVLHLQPEAIRRTALAMLGENPDQDRLPPQLALFPPQTLPPHRSQPLRSLLRHIDACAAADPALPERLGLDDVVLRLAASWLHPALLEPKAAPGPHCGRGGGTALDDLIDYIRANLHRPLRLSDLEARSWYSRRALQYAFRDRFGTSPSQWIREQRLTQAMEQLQGNTEQRLSVRAVALACGYRHRSLFNADFKRRFGLSPSEVRRPRLS